MSAETLAAVQTAVDAHVADLEGESVGVSFVVGYEATKLSDGEMESTYFTGDAVSPAHSVGILTEALRELQKDLS